MLFLYCTINTSTIMDATVENMMNCLKEQLIEAHNIRMSYIARIMDKYKYLGTKIDVKLVDSICDKPIQELANLDVVLHGICTEVARITISDRRAGLDYE